jgi:hypothetical protein
MSFTKQNLDGDVRGEMVQVCIDGVMSVFQDRMRDMLDEEGIERPDPQPDEWYPLGKFLNVLEAVEQNTGESALNKVGESTPRFLDWPSQIESPQDGLDHLEEVYKTEHRNADGNYICESHGEGHAVIRSTTPYPVAWEVGFIKGTTQHFGADYGRVDATEEGSETVFKVNW